MPRTGVPYDDVAHAIQTLQKAGVNPSIRMIREKLGKGSLTTIAEHKRTYEADQANGPTDALPDPIARSLLKGAETFWQELVDAAETDIERIRDNATQTTGSLEQRLKDADEEILALKDTLGTQTHAIAELKKAVADADNKVVEREKALQSKEVAMSRLSGELETMQAQHHALQVECNATQDALNEAQIDQARLRERIERDAVEYAKDKITLQKHFNEYKDRLVTMSDEGSQARKAQREAETGAAAAEQRAANAEQTLERQSQESESLKDEIRLLTEHLGEARGRLAATESSFADEKAATQRLIDEKDNQARTLQAALEDMQRLVRRYEPDSSEQ